MESLPLLEHPVAVTVQSTILSASQLLDYRSKHLTEESPRDFEILTRSLLSVSLRCAHRLFVRSAQEDQASLASKAASLCFRAFESCPFDHTILESVFHWFSTLVGPPRSNKVSLSLEMLSPHLPKMVSNLRGHNATARLWTLEILHLLAKEENSTVPQTQVLCQVSKLHTPLQSKMTLQ